MPAKSDCVRTRFHPCFINIFFTSVPMSMPISRYILPLGVIQCFAFFAMDSYAARPLLFAYNAMSGSWVAASFTRVSVRAIYGGFDTIISNVWPKLCGRQNVVCIVFILLHKLCVRMFRRATRNARYDLSIAVPCALDMFLHNAQIMHPVPVPRSKIVGAVSDAQSEITADTSVSVSGRGSKVCQFV